MIRSACTSITGNHWTLDHVLGPAYNAAPTQMLPLIRATETGPELAPLTGLTDPIVAKEASIGSKMITARGAA